MTLLVLGSMGLLALLTLGIVLVVVVVLAARRGGDPALEENEARLLQEIHHSLEALEGRIDVLETVLLEREKAKASAAEPPAPARGGD